MVHICNGIVLSHKKNEIMLFAATWMDYHTKWRRSDKEIQISYDITFMRNLKKWYKWTYLQNTNRLTDIENKLMVIKGDSGGGDKLGVWD